MLNGGGMVSATQFFFRNIMRVSKIYFLLSTAFRSALQLYKGKMVLVLAIFGLLINPAISDCFITF